MYRSVSVLDADINHRTVYFDLYQLDGKTPAIAEAGGQPEISFNAGSFNATGISTLTHTGFGRYTAVLDVGVLLVSGDVIRTRYKSGATLEARGDTFLIAGTIVQSTTGTVSGLSYVTVEEGDIFFSNRLRAQAWTDATYEDRRKSLCQATQLIDNLNFAGDLASSSQLLQFPRSNTDYDDVVTADVVVPTSIKNATCLVAIKLLDGFDIDMEIENLSKVGMGYHQARSNFDRTFVLEHLRAGIPSSEAWTLLKPFLRDVRNISMSRV